MNALIHGPSDETALSAFGAGPGTTRRVALVLAALCVLALLLRVWFAMRSGCWRDEGQFLWVMRIRTVGAMVEFLRSHEAHPPLFYFLMRAWLAVFGDSETAALVPPILFGVAQVPLAHFAGSRMFNARTGLIAAVLVTLSTTLIVFSAMIRPYSLMPLLCLASGYLLWRGLLGRGMKSWAAYAAVTLAILLSHNWGWLVWGAQWVAAGIWFLWRREPERPARMKGWALAQIAVAAGYAPWWPTLLYQTRHGAPFPHPESLAYKVRYSLESIISLPQWGAIAVLAFLVGAAIVRRTRLPRTADAEVDWDRRLALLLTIGIPLVAVIAPVVLSARTNLMQSRCLVMVAPCALLAISYGIDRLSSRRPLVTLLATCGLAGLYLAASVVYSRRIKSNAREIAAAVARHARSDDLLVIVPDWLASSFNYYYRLDNQQIDFPHEGREGAVPFDEYWVRMADPGAMASIRRQLVQARAQERRVWLLMERNVIEGGVPVMDTLLQGPHPVSYGLVVPIRASQVRGLLITLYGPPDTSSVPPDRRAGNEIITAMLFEPRAIARESKP